MPSVDVVNMDMEKVGEVDLSTALFGANINRSLLHEVATLARSNQRAGTRVVKGRSAVSGGGRKPWRQKGTGRARVGSSRSPLWRGGGTTFGSQPKEYDVRIPKKKRRAALCAALTWKLQSGRLTVLDRVQVEEGRTREIAGWLKKSGWSEGGSLLVHTGESNLLSRAARNIPGVKVTHPGGVNLYDLFLYRHLMFTREALGMVEEVWGK